MATKKSYTSPRLIVHGSVESITLQGARTGVVDVPLGTPVNPDGNCTPES